MFRCHDNEKINIDNLKKTIELYNESIRYDKFNIISDKHFIYYLIIV